LEEPAVVTARGLVLVEEGEMGGIELAEPFVPFDRFQLPVVVREGDAQYADIVAVAGGAAHVRGGAAACLGPAADLIVVGGGAGRWVHDGLRTVRPSFFRPRAMNSACGETVAMGCIQPLAG